MRICLICPPITGYGSAPQVVWPIGLAYIAAVLEKHHEVFVIDAPAEGHRNLQRCGTEWYLGLTLGEITSKVRGIKPDVVGITSPFARGAADGFSVAQAIKGAQKNTVVILGGADASARPLHYLRREGVDFVVVGEGEHTVVELAHVLEHGARDELRNVKGIAYLESGEPVITPPRPLITDLDSLPFPARHLFPVDDYFKAAKRGLAPIWRINKPWVNVLTSRGCPYNCVFCAGHIVTGKKYRARSPENVVQELEHLVNTYGVKQIDFLDDNMTLNKLRMEQILDLMIERRLGIEWCSQNGIRADSIDENILKKMKRAGCWRVWVSPESGVQRVLDTVIKKKQSLKKAEEVVAMCKKVGIQVGCNLVIGFPGETKEDIEQTVQYARKLRKIGAFRVSTFTAIPFYGTELYQQVKEIGLLLREPDEKSMLMPKIEPFFETADWTASEIESFREEAMKANPLIHRDVFHTSAIPQIIRAPKRSVKFLLRTILRIIRK